MACGYRLGGFWHATLPRDMSCTTLCLETIDPSALLAEARLGNREAFATLVLPYAPRLYRRALRLTGNPADAEDARQDALMKALTRIDQFSGKQREFHNDLNAWVTRIASNASIDLLRQRRDSKHVPLENSDFEAGENFAGHLSAHGATPEESYARREMRSLLARAITQLPSDLRQVCLLRDVLQYSTQEVADRLGISSVAVRLRLFRAHRRLHDELRAVLRRNHRKTPSRAPASKPAPSPTLKKLLPLSAVPNCACGD
jgi:RNA polymerase sigma-70 factor, ECF subfamily